MKTIREIINENKDNSELDITIYIGTSVKNAIEKITDDDDGIVWRNSYGSEDATILDQYPVATEIMSGAEWEKAFLGDVVGEIDSDTLVIIVS